MLSLNIAAKILHESEALAHNKYRLRGKQNQTGDSFKNGYRKIRELYLCLNVLKLYQVCSSLAIILCYSHVFLFRVAVSAEIQPLLSCVFITNKLS